MLKYYTCKSKEGLYSQGEATTHTNLTSAPTALRVPWYHSEQIQINFYLIPDSNQGLLDGEAASFFSATTKLKVFSKTVTKNFQNKTIIMFFNAAVFKKVYVKIIVS